VKRENGNKKIEKGFNGKNVDGGTPGILGNGNKRNKIGGGPEAAE